MIYKNFKDLKLSSLGMGCMRLPHIGTLDKIDIPAVKEMVAYAMEKGINYYDTAWGYHNGMSEPVMGEVLSEYPRESFYLATKFPGYDLANFGKIEEIFEKQLSRLRVDYFDFFLIHNVCEQNIDYYLNPEYKTLEYVLEQKKNGRIRHLGFSIHATLETMKRFMAVYGDYMEFCQIQLNWLDYDFQNAKAKVELLNERNIPIWVMEPLRGGSLCTLDPEHVKRLGDIHPDYTVTEWAFRFLQSFDAVTVTLSGMSNFEQVAQNIATFEESKPLGDEEKAVLFEIAREMTSRNTLPCTACSYCTAHCPMELDIPMIIEQYNKHIRRGGSFSVPKDIAALDESKQPTACIGCRCCEAVCPQQIEISDTMAYFARRFNNKRTEV